MERTGESFPLEEIFVRNYEEKDYFEWDRICELAFYYMRQSIGMYPSFFYTPVEWEREQFAKNKDNMFVMIVDNTIVAIGKINGNKISIVAVSIEHQSRGYGRKFVKFLANEIISRGEDKVILEVVKGNFAKKSLYPLLSNVFIISVSLSKQVNTVCSTFSLCISIFSYSFMSVEPIPIDSYSWLTNSVACGFLPKPLNDRNPMTVVSISATRILSLLDSTSL